MTIRMKVPAGTQSPVNAGVIGNSGGQNFPVHDGTHIEVPEDLVTELEGRGFKKDPAPPAKPKPAGASPPTPTHTTRK